MFELIGYVFATLIGVTLGLIGGGGSVLTVPVLVYLVGLTPVMATAYSLFIVGSSAAFGGYRYARKSLVNFKMVFTFGIPSLIAVFLTRKFIVPAIPDTILELGSFVFTKDAFLMSLFAILMLLASWGMIRKRKESKKTGRELSGSAALALVLIEGFVVGTLTGLVGAGGGFLIIPALVVITKMDMKAAVGTSLFIISMKSLIGFLGDVSNYTIDWTFLLIFSGLAVVGIFIGSFLSTKIDGNKLKAGFGWFILVMGAFILTKELFL